MDDNETIIVKDEELLLVDNVVRDFENVSGAILNRSKKSKILGLGDWSDRAVWPLPWLKVQTDLKIFGFVISQDFGSILDKNWSSQLDKFRNTLYSWSSRVLSLRCALCVGKK